jgi:hypothetical protein
MAEIARPHPRSDYQVVKLDPVNADSGGGRVDRSRVKVHTGHFGEHHTDIVLLGSELPDRGGNLGWRKNSHCDLIEQWLEDIVIASVNENDIRIGSLQSASRGDTGKPAANDYDTLSSQARWTCYR